MLDTQGQLDEEVLPRSRRRQFLTGGVRLRVVVFALMSALVVTGVRLALSASPYTIERPGPAISLPRVASGGTRTIHNFSYTTVDIVRASWWDYFYSTEFNHVAHSAFTRVTAESATDLRLQNASDAQAMRQAKASAVYLAFYLVEGKSPLVGAGAQVVSVDKSSPASSAGLVSGDVITAVNKQAVTTPDGLRHAIETTSGAVTLHVRRHGSLVALNVIPEPNAQHLRRIGVVITPFEQLNQQAQRLKINTQGVSGPSGGLMFTLALIDSLSPGDLSGRERVSGTGEISSLGIVGPIGGVRYKVAGAVRTGATVFFVPTDNAADAADAAPPSLKVVPVSSIYDALSYLCDHGATDRICSRLATVHALLAGSGAVQ